MNTSVLVREILNRLVKWRIGILIAGISGCGLLAFYARSQRAVYTAKATIFPLTNAAENSLSSNALSGILGLGDVPKSFSSEAAINIIELTLSRYVRESVASSRLPALGNKTIAQLLVEDQHRHHALWEKEIPLPADSTELAVIGGELLNPGITAKMSRNGVLEMYFSHPDTRLVSPVAYMLIDKVSQFYIDLKIKKATADYNFTVRKIDSLDAILGGIDRRAIRMQNTTLFAPSKLEYEIPKERINSEKQRYVRQRDISLNNQEEALWRLQKLTPIISVLDKPTPPFVVKKPSVMVYAIAGLVAGCLLASLLAVAGLLFKYCRDEIRKSIWGESPSVRS